MSATYRAVSFLLGLSVVLSQNLLLFKLDMDRNNKQHDCHFSSMEVFEQEKIDDDQIIENYVQAMSWSEC